MAHYRALVIEDDAAVRRGVVDALRFAGFDTVESRNGEVERTPKVPARLMPKAEGTSESK